MNIATSLVVGLVFLLLTPLAGHADPDAGSVFGMVFEEDGTPVVSAMVKFHLDTHLNDEDHGPGGQHGHHGDNDDDEGHHGHHGDDDDHMPGHGHSMFTTFTNASGIYVISEVPAGPGWAMAAKPGFGHDFQEVVIEAGVQNRYDFHLDESHGYHGSGWMESMHD